MRLALISLLMIPLAVGCGSNKDGEDSGASSNADADADASSDADAGSDADADSDADAGADADEDGTDPTVDNDGDGVPADEDCDDDDAALGPISEDADCDGVLTADDCDDTDSSVHPDADELCDGIDNNCDGVTDTDAIDILTLYSDLDGDGHGSEALTTTGCEASEGFALTADDCDDSDATISPSADELCDTVDNDCDEEIDEDAVDTSTWYFDADGDGAGNPSTAYAMEACAPDEGFVDNPDDCNDLDATIFPGAPESCDAVDRDCDGTAVEDDAADAPIWFMDSDGDGYGTGLLTTTACSEPEGFAATEDDCDDGNSSIFPGADERCDGEDNDCDGATDEDDAIDVATWYADADEDDFGDPETSVDACSAPEGYIEDATDCDDTSGAIHPEASETCDAIDNDCDGSIDEEGATDAPIWYRDTDGDGYAGESETTVSCASPGADFYSDAADCDDADPTIFPAAAEVCDDTDNDCDDVIDEDGATDAPIWYMDADSDGFGDASTALAACTAPEGYTTDASDCQDDDPTISPDATEVCDDVDNDCDGSADESDSVDAPTWYADLDGDGFAGDIESVRACEAPTDHYATADDCDDDDPDTSPGAEEVCADELDNDCSGVADDAEVGSTWYMDSDGDGYGRSSVTMVSCGVPEGYVDNNDDCNDDVSTTHPGAVDICSDAVDNDCDGSVDEAAVDADGDGWRECDGDCDDSNIWVNPGYGEICDNGIDDDCDGLLDIADQDGDGFFGCGAPEAIWQDCNDFSDSMSPGLSEVPGDGLDNDCDQQVDNLSDDDDGDGYSEDDGDCDDSMSEIYPGAEEFPDNDVDENCDGSDSHVVDWTTTVAGVFVDASIGDDFFPGTQEYPVATITRGAEIAESTGGDVVVAAGIYDESVYTTARIHGGFESEGWTRSSDLSTLTYLDAPDASFIKTLNGIRLTETADNPNAMAFGVEIHSTSRSYVAENGTYIHSILYGPRTSIDGDIATISHGTAVHSQVMGGRTSRKSWTVLGSARFSLILGAFSDDGEDGEDGYGYGSGWEHAYCMYGSSSYGFTYCGRHVWYAGSIQRYTSGEDGGDGGDGSDVIGLFTYSGPEYVNIGNYITGGRAGAGGNGGNGQDGRDGDCDISKLAASGGDGGNAGANGTWTGSTGGLQAHQTIVAYDQFVGKAAHGVGGSRGAKDYGSVDGGRCYDRLYYGVYDETSGTADGEDGLQTEPAHLYGVQSMLTSIIHDSDITLIGDSDPGKAQFMGAEVAEAHRTNVTVDLAASPANCSAVDVETAITGSVVHVGGDCDQAVFTGSDTRVFNNTVVTDGIGTGIVAEGTSWVANNLVHATGSGPCMELNGSTVGMLANNLFSGCDEKLIYDTSVDSLRTSILAVNFLSATHGDGGNIMAEPSFEDLSDGGFALGSGSPAIDAGYDLSAADYGPTHDIDWNECPTGVAYDIGAHEYQD